MGEGGEGQKSDYGHVYERKPTAGKLMLPPLSKKAEVLVCGPTECISPATSTRL